MRKSNQAERIRIDGDVIYYTSGLRGDWTLPVDDVRLIGEATNEDGPFADDYFLCFATGPDHCHEASFYAEGMGDFFSLISDRLDSAILPGLTGSTSFDSRILWPEHAKGKAMFDFEEHRPASFFRRLAAFVVGTSVRRELSSVSQRVLGAGDGI